MKPSSSTRPQRAAHRRPLGLCTALLALVCSAAAVASAQTSPSALHPQQVRVHLTTWGGFVRLPLEAPVVAQAGPGLSRLRLIGPSGESLPFAVQTTPRSEEHDVLTPPSLPREASQTTQPGEPPLYLETYELDLPTGAPPGSPWALDLDVALPTFTAEITTTSLSGGSEQLQTRTVFRLRDGATRTQIELPVADPTSAAPAGARRPPSALRPGTLRVAIRSQDGHLSPTFRFVSRAPAQEAVELEIPFSRVAESRSAGLTTLELTSPSGMVPSAIRFSSSTPSFVRPVRVEARVGDRFVEVTRSVITRGTGSDLLTVPLVPLRASSWRVTLTDDASPPLGELGVEAVIGEPSLVFAAAHAGGDADSLRLVFGGVRAIAPRFPEQDALASMPLDALPRATHGAIEPNPDHRDAPALGFAMHPGAEIDERAYRHVAALTVPPSTEGAVRVALPLEVLAAARSGLVDVRVVDAQGRQWPYVTVDAESTPFVDVGARRESTTRHASGVRTVYVVELPAGGLELRALRLDPDAALVDRPVVVESIEPGDARLLLTRGRLERLPGREAATDLALPPGRRQRLRITVEDGDEAPLTLRASVSYDQPALYLAAPAGTYRLLVGFEPIQTPVRAPVYDLESARALLLSVRPVDARLGPLGPNPRFEPPSPFSRERGQDIALWAVLGFATLALLGLTLRLSRTEPG